MVQVSTLGEGDCFTVSTKRTTSAFTANVLVELTIKRFPVKKIVQHYYGASVRQYYGEVAI
eukprot:scaffold34652_cov211-Amphora_coffeaeformis.AAC.6